MKNSSFWKFVGFSVAVCLFTTMSAIIIPQASADSFGDPFEGNDLHNPSWEWQNEPPTWDISGGNLNIDSQPNRNVWASDDSHFLYQDTDTDMFDVSTHFRANWDADSGVNGILVKSPTDNNWVTVKFWSRDAGPQGHIQYQTRQAGMGPPDVQWRFGDWGDVELSFRLKKEGNTYTAWYKAEGDEDWMDIGEGTFDLTPPLQLGIYAGVAAGSGSLKVEYAYFEDHLNPTDVEPEGKVATTWGIVKSRY